MNPFSFEPTFLLPIVTQDYYVVPLYQRSYAWDSEMVEEFWTDMQNAVIDKREHFMGNIVLSSETDGNSLSIVDGQQRIVTTTLLLSALRDHFKIENDTEASSAIDNYIKSYDVTTLETTQRVRMNADDNEFYSKRFVYGQSESPSKESHKLMDQAYGIFFKRIQDIKDQNPSSWRSEFKKYTTFLGKQARIVAVRAPTDADAFTIFETLNDRGADLTTSDLLKNLLFSRATSAEIEVVKQRWIEARAVIDELAPRASFMVFLRHYWSSRNGTTRERDLYKRIKQEVTTKQKALNFSSNLKDDASLYSAILTPNDDYWKNFSPSAKIALQSFDKFNLEQIRPLLLAIYKHFPKQEMEAASKSILNWTVRGLVVGVIGAGKAETYFCNAAVNIRDGKIKDVAGLLSELRDLLPTDAAFSSAVETYRTTTNSFARYMLICIENHLNNQKEPELVPNQNADEINLEHVLPQKAKTADWPNFSPDMVSLYAYRLGNMTLLKKGKNGKIGNKQFSIKQPILAASMYQMNKIFQSATSWSPGDIDSRQKAFAIVAPKVWPLA